MCILSDISHISNFHHQEHHLTTYSASIMIGCIFYKQYNNNPINLKPIMKSKQPCPSPSQSSGLRCLPPTMRVQTQSVMSLCLQISAVEVSYLQSTTIQNPHRIRYLWWGCSNSMDYEFLFHQSPHQFYIQVSRDMFLRYCEDMKVLNFIVISQHGKMVLDGVLNFSILAGWQGEDCRLVAELKKKGNVKAGEIIFDIQIKEVVNPFYRNEIPSNDTPTIQTTTQQQVQPKVVKKQTSPIISIAQSQEVFEQKQPIPKPRCKKIPIPIQASECICPGLDSQKHSLQKLRLRQQLSLLLPSPSHFPPQQCESLSLQLLGWEPLSRNDAQLPCRLCVPFLHPSTGVYRNQYTFARGTGTVVIQLNAGLPENTVKHYLQKQAVQVQVGKYSGRVDMFRLVAARGGVVVCGLTEKVNKKDTLKGHVSLRILANKQSQLPAKPQSEPQQQTSSSPAPASPSIPHNPCSHIWLYLQQVHLVSPQQHPHSNLFLQINSATQSHRSKTCWDCQAPNFKQILTMEMPAPPALSVEVWDRRQTDRLLGKAMLQVPAVTAFRELELQVVDHYGRVQAYLGLCVGMGDLTAATQFLNSHSKNIHNPNQKPNSNRPPPQKKSSTSSHPQQEPSQPNIPPIQLSNQSQKHSCSSSMNNQSNQKPHISSGIGTAFPSSLSPSPSPQLSILQLHNRIFSLYLQNSHSWLSQYPNMSPTLAEMCLLLEPLCTGLQATKLCSIYLQGGNCVAFGELRESYESFLVYYDILTIDRDGAVGEVLAVLAEQGVSINQLEGILQRETKGKAKSKHGFWDIFKDIVGVHLEEKIRIFWASFRADQLCDVLRKFQVYETTHGEQHHIQNMKSQVKMEIAELLDIDPQSPLVYSSIKSAGLELSKFQQLCLFGQIPTIHQKMIKSPTFGLLTTQRPLPLLINPQHNPSLALALSSPSPQSNQQLPSDYGQSQVQPQVQKKIGSPTISPINSHPRTAKMLRVGFMDVPGNIVEIQLNGRVQAVDSNGQGNGQLLVRAERNFSYKGWIRIEDLGSIEFEGVPGEWIGLVGEDGSYCGCLFFN